MNKLLRKASVALLCLLPHQVQAADARPIMSVTPIFGQLLMTALPNEFQPAFEKTQDTQYILEAVPVGENVNQWSQMITITGAKGLADKPGVTPKKVLEGIASGYKRACPTSFSAASIAEGKISGFDAFSVVISCGSSPASAGKTSESALITAIKGEHDFYTIQWSERTAPSSTPLAINTTSWNERLKKLAPIKLCPVVLGEAAPYPSCVGKN